MKTTTPKYFRCWNMSIMQLFGKGPKVHIICGECGISSNERVDMVDNPPLICPYCGTINMLPFTVSRS